LIEWFSPKELLNIAGLPNTVQGVIARAKREEWKSRPRRAQGGGKEYHISSLPAETQAALRQQQPEQPDTITPEQEERLTTDQFGLIPMYDVQASAGHGSFVEQEREIGRIAFRKDWLRSKGLNLKDLVVITISGDSMEPTLRDQAIVLVDTSHQVAARDGIYVLRNEFALFAKRIAMDYGEGGIKILSDNPIYAPVAVPKEAMGNIQVVGKVIWVGQEMQ